MSAVGNALGIPCLGWEGPAPAPARALAPMLRVTVRRRVVWVGDHLVGHVFLLAEELAQADDAGEQESDLAHEERFSDQEDESFEGEGAEEAELHGTGS